MAVKISVVAPVARILVVVAAPAERLEAQILVVAALAASSAKTI